MTSIYHLSCVLVLFAIQTIDSEIEHDNTCSEKTAEHITSILGQITRKSFESQLKPSSKHNVVVSPLAIYNSLYLLYIGSAGQTATNFTYGLVLPQTGVREAFDRWQNCVFSQRAHNGTLSNVNAVIVYGYLAVNKEYAMDVNDIMKNSFAKNPSIRNIACDKINEQMTTSTDGAPRQKSVQNKPFEEPDEWFQLMCSAGIPNIPSPQLVVVNDFLFDAPWACALPFRDDKETHNFHTPDGVKQVKMMLVTTAQHAFIQTENGRITRSHYGVELPFGGKGGNFSLYLHRDNRNAVVPQRMREFYNVITSGQIITFTPNIEVYVPSFELQPDAIDLEDTVRKLGLGILYENPDLTGIVSDGTLNNIKMIHRASFAVSGNPNNASSTKTPSKTLTTTTSHDTTSARVMHSTPHERRRRRVMRMRYNRPFYAIVLHRPSNTPVLTAYIQDPTLDPVRSQSRHKESTKSACDIIEPSPTSPSPTSPTQQCPSCCSPSAEVFGVRCLDIMGDEICITDATCWKIANKLLESFPRQPYTAEALKYFEYEMLCHRPDVCPK